MFGSTFVEKVEIGGRIVWFAFCTVWFSSCGFGFFKILDKLKKPARESVTVDTLSYRFVHSDSPR